MFSVDIQNIGFSESKTHCQLFLPVPSNCTQVPVNYPSIPIQLLLQVVVEGGGQSGHIPLHSNFLQHLQLLISVLNTSNSLVNSYKIRLWLLESQSGFPISHNNAIIIFFMALMKNLNDSLRHWVSLMPVYIIGLLAGLWCYPEGIRQHLWLQLQ